MAQSVKLWIIRKLIMNFFSGFQILCVVLSCATTVTVAAAQPSNSNSPTTANKHDRNSAISHLPITISKKTTYITEPRRDGYPDYIAAMNQIASRGVTPDNNAVVILMQAFGPELTDYINGKYSQSERDLFFKMLGGNPPAAKGKYFVGYEEYVAEHAPSALKKEESSLEREADRQRDQTYRPWTRKEYPLVAGWLGNRSRLGSVFVKN